MLIEKQLLCENGFFLSSEEDPGNVYFSNILKGKKVARKMHLERKQREYRKNARERLEAKRLSLLVSSFGNSDNLEARDTSDPTLPSLGNDTSPINSNVLGSTHNADRLEDIQQPPEVDSDTTFDETAKQNEVDKLVSQGSSASDLSESENFSAVHTADVPGTRWFDVRDAVNSTNMNTTQVVAVLKVLHKHGNLIGKLHKSHKTLCKVTGTHTPCEIEVKSGHEYFYFGLESQLKQYLRLYPESKISELDTIFINVNNDGLPLYKSNNISSWQILVCISDIKPRKVFPVVITAGPGIPHNLEYLEDFINEVRQIRSSGVWIHEKKKT